MKKSILVVSILCLFTFFGYSQFNKGSLLLGADLSFNTSSSNNGNSESKGHGFAFSPTVAVASRLNTFWGGSLGIGYSRNTSTSPNETQQNNNYSAGIFCRKYKQAWNKLYAFIQAGVNAGYGKYKTDIDPNSHYETKSFNTALAITPGISFSASKKVFLEAGFSNVASVNYQHSTSTYSDSGNITKGKSNSFGFSSSLGSFSNNLYFGFRFIIPKS